MSTGKGARYFRVRRKPDANQAAIVAALRAVGMEVFDLSGCGYGVPDIAVLKPDKSVVWMELKTDKGQLRPAQSAVRELWRVVIVRSVSEALQAVGVR